MQSVKSSEFNFCLLLKEGNWKLERKTYLRLGVKVFYHDSELKEKNKSRRSSTEI
jgi:hypothetical protein